MKLVVLIEPHAVDKMTVGQELCRKTGLKLFHNHMSIEIVTELFANMPEERRRLIDLIREEVFQASAKGPEYGLVFTYMCDFNSPEDWACLEHAESIFREAGTETYYAELMADQGLRLARNRTENRLLHKPSKRIWHTRMRCFANWRDASGLTPGQGRCKRHIICICAWTIRNCPRRRQRDESTRHVNDKPSPLPPVILLFGRIEKSVPPKGEVMQLRK